MITTVHRRGRNIRPNHPTYTAARLRKRTNDDLLLLLETAKRADPTTNLSAMIDRVEAELERRSRYYFNRF